MALSLRKPGKLHAICARLHQTQGDSNGWSDPTVQSPTEERDPENNNIPIDLGKTNSHSSPPSPENSSFSQRSMTSVATEGSNGRRKNRKSAVPRNLAQVNDYLERFDEEKDELMEYKINNLNSDFPPINSSNEGSDDEKMSDEGDENGVSNDCKEGEMLITDDQNNNATQFSSGALDVNSITCGKHNSENISAETRSEGVLDLSIQKVTNGSKPNTDEDLAFSENSQSDNDEETSSTLATEKNGGDVDVAYLKSYAERTMNEFLKMYGFSGDSASALTEHMALQKFALGKMLQGSEGLLNSPAAMMPFGFPLNKSGAVRLLTSPAVNHPTPSNGRLLNTPKFSGVSEEIPTSAGNSPSIAGLPLVVSPLVSRAPSTSSCDTQGSMVTSPSKVVLPDYSKYIRRYSSAQECGGGHCCDMGYREHFHCLDCNFKVFVRKEEMIRHFKWHKKRDDSLQHGFMRYSPLDDCSKEFGVCTHNGRQTHYHCLQSGCDKVYISTSDVQMHANYHRKDSAIIQEGFQRFRATEDCGTPSCAFYGQRTTHFHCRRQDCRFTFKNKADMEKHKSYHQKDEILGRDGFKKFMKYEHCPFSTCRFSKISNHIHCIRPGCDYVLHSTGQLYSHKRKHERRDFESAYRRFKENQKTRPVVPKAERPLHPAFGAVGRLPVPRMPNFHPVASMATPIPFPSTNGSRMLNGTPVKKESEYVDIEHLSQLNVSEENSLSGSTSPVSLTTSVQSDAKADSQVSVKVEPEEMDENGETSSSLPSGKPATGLAAYNDDISGDQLNDSLTLPIPKYTDAPTTDTPQTSPQLPYTPNQSPPKTPLPLTASGLSTPVGMISSPGTASVGSANSTPGRDWPPRLTMSTERKPRDESWKAYIERYTANDPCNSRCQYLYKDHYHCKVENCTVLFKSKDAVREHARYHELQERITAMAYSTHESFQTCPQECELSQKHKHYHCVWTNCSHVILDSGPIFSRLEHYRIHEYARASAGKSGKMPACKFDSPDFGKRRRGRPPKYPKSEIPVVPKVELSEEELTSLNMAGKASDGRLVSSFKKFDEKQPCPDELCLFYCKSHFHCARPRCHHATDREDVLNLHTKDFHSFVDILEGFEFFDRNVNCRRLQCHNNKANRHFHCIRPRCDYSFVRHTTMAQHEKKHAGETDEESGDKINQAAKRDLGNFVPIAPAPEWRPKTVVKAAGTFYPISTIGHGLRPSGVTTHGGSLLQVASVSPTLGALSSPQLTYPTTTIDTQTGVPLTVLLQKKPDNQIPLPSWSTLRAQMHFGLQQNCARPFCKLKKKDHYHCLECNQAFSDPARLRSHIGKHGIKLERVDSGMRVHRTLPIAPRMSVAASDVPEDLSVRSEKSEKVNQEQYFSERNSDSLATSESEDSLEAEDLSTNKSSVTASSSLNLNPASFSDILAESQQLRNYYVSSGTLDQEHSASECDNSDEDTTPLIRFGRKRSASDVDGSLEGNSSSAKQAKLSGSSTREEDGSVPQGYSRYRFTEDCGFDTCVYRQTLTHYHCERADCGYSFSNRTRVVQHTQRHERIDGITGNEFRQYRGNVDCQHVGCEYRNRSSHFHCLLCAYVCMDAAQVLAHRKHHLKMNKIISQGFQKFSGTEDCKILTCTYYYKKQTHYHCTEKGCTYVVLSPSQMASHKMKHMRDNV